VAKHPQYLPTAGYLRLLLICLALQSALAVYSAWTAPPQVPLVARWLVGMDPAAAEQTPDVDRARAVSWLEIVTGIASAVLFIPMLARINQNARTLGTPDLDATPGWTIGCFLVPILNLYKPHKVVQELWKSSSPAPRPWRTNPASLLVTVWWLQRLFDGGWSQALWLWRRWYPLESTVGLLRGVEVARLATVSQGLHIVQFALTGLVAAALHRRQTARLRKLGGESPSAENLSSGAIPLVLESFSPNCYSARPE
jgi:hypothetical protein